MKICFVDEAGCTGTLPSSTSNIQPVFTIGAVVIDQAHLSSITIDYINLKRTFFPAKMDSQQYMGNILKEIKGSEIRANACSDRRKIRRHSYGYVDKLLKIIEDSEGKIFGRVWIKDIGAGINGRSLYTASIQRIFQCFQKYLELIDDTGIIVVDSRLKHLNSQVSHSIFTQKFKTTGDNYDRILELPLFAHSDNHAGLQIADNFYSSLIFPLSVHSYCVPYVNNLHVRPRYNELKATFAERIRGLQFMYHEGGRWNGGIVTSDPLGTKSSRALFV